MRSHIPNPIKTQCPDRFGRDYDGPTVIGRIGLMGRKPTSSETPGGNVPILRVLKEWDDEQAASRGGDRKKCRQAAQGLFAHNPDWEGIRDITRAGVLAFLAAPKPDGTPKSGHTYNNLLSRLRSFEQWLCDTHRITDGERFMNGIKSREGGTGDGCAAFTVDEARSLISQARRAQTRTKNVRGHRWATYLAAITTGTRPGELSKTERRDYNLTEIPYTLEIRPEIAKTGKRRFQPLNRETVRALREIGIEKMKPNQKPFAIMPSGNTVAADLVACGIDRVDKRGRRKALYSARHSYATWLPADFKSKLLGHGSLLMRYDDPEMPDLAAAVEGLPRLVVDWEDGPENALFEQPKGPSTTPISPPPHSNGVKPPITRPHGKNRANRQSPPPQIGDEKRRGGDSNPPLSRKPFVTQRGGYEMGGGDGSAVPAPHHSARPVPDLDEPPSDRLRRAEAALSATYAAYRDAQREHRRAVLDATRAGDSGAANQGEDEQPTLKIRSA